MRAHTHTHIARSQDGRCADAAGLAGARPLFVHVIVYYSIL